MAIITTLLTATATGAMSAIGSLAVQRSATMIGRMTDWTLARETFTKNTALEMFNARPEGYVAAVCYNQGWEVKNATLSSEVISVRLDSGRLNTE